jgi:hypothetical protein
LALVAVAAFALVGGAASAAASTNYACPGQQSFEGITTGSYNTACGLQAMKFDTEGNGNEAYGYVALQNNSTGSGNVAVGVNASGQTQSGGNNVAIGGGALYENIAGELNVALGNSAGYKVTGSSNIDISNEGVAGESGTTRIGTEGKQTKAFVSGIYPTSPPGGSKTCTVKVTEAGQLVCSEPPAPKGLKICVPEKAGKPITLAPCTKRGYKEKEVAEL